MRIFYGTGKRFIDVTQDALANCCDGDRIYIPSGDTGSTFFPDPAIGVAKTIIVIRSEQDQFTCQQYWWNESVRIHLSDNEIQQFGLSARQGSQEEYNRKIEQAPAFLSTPDKIEFYHSQLQCAGGDIAHEWQEQAMVVHYLDPNAKVLELGSCIGRNTMMISCVLKDERNLVTLECNPVNIEILRNNRFANKLNFHIEPSALSYRKLMQARNLAPDQSWEALPGEDLVEGFDWVSTITFEELEEKYGIHFDALVADCEGALFYILQDNDSILENISTVILESDFRQADQKWAVESAFTKYGLEKIHAVSLVPNLTDLPQECADSFWEVWRKGS